MKKVILVIFCTAILMSGCSSNTADTVSNDVGERLLVVIEVRIVHGHRQRRFRHAVTGLQRRT